MNNAQRITRLKKKIKKAFRKQSNYHLRMGRYLVAMEYRRRKAESNRLPIPFKYSDPLSADVEEYIKRTREAEELMMNSMGVPEDSYYRASGI